MKIMSLVKFCRMVAFVLMLCLPAGMAAQSNGDKLFMEGQQLQQLQTVSSQNAAIKKFRAAKVVYTTAEKKKICDNQIAICYNNIRAIRAKSKSVEQTPVSEKEEKAEVKEKKDVRKDVELSLSETRLDFKSKPKEGATQSVEVECNYDDWEIASNPEWVTVYLSEKKFTVEAEENTGEEDRSGVIVVKCGDKEVNLVVNQDKRKNVEKVMDKVGGFFKKKK